MIEQKTQSKLQGKLFELAVKRTPQYRKPHALLALGLLAALGLGACEQSSTTDETRETGGATSKTTKTDLVPLLSYEAAYELSLHRTAEGSGVTGYQGLMLVDWVDACDGYTSDQRIGAVIARTNGSEIISDFTSTTWESRDQSLFRFSMTTKMNGKVTDRVEGRGTHSLETGKGNLVFKEPEVETRPVTMDVLFPTQYIIELLEAAQAGESIFQSKMADGSDEIPIYDVVTFIGPLTPPEKEAPGYEGGEALKGLGSWQVQIGYHDPEGQDGLPEVQVSMRIYENGFGADLILDYGDFALKGTVSKLRVISDAGC